ncbi:MAG TPA: histidine phosphatase family protein [Ramlibacter sp.]|jgi:broad specificity phosphatase PhoE|uniref:histidine phosphatase family protein n=1 Tax=Ramlibacter sp. TaxID=1917967 RepID=UPI002D482276|nr:histidine phosphatase family protein [Ramlibacter sp.]HZY18141.1 histidine phosphatase family protein [Ramlibacter sp.]
MHTLFRVLLACVSFFLAGAASAADAWAALARPGAVLLLRHATAPGVGDPPGFRLGDCSTQRNLDDEGRDEARRLGDLFRRRGIQVGAVWTSQWCRTRETARLAFGDAVQDQPVFNSFFGADAVQRDAQTRQARELLARWRGPGVLVAVTHQVNITALTGAGMGSAEGVVVRPRPDGRLEVVGTVQP